MTGRSSIKPDRSGILIEQQDAPPGSLLPTAIVTVVNPVNTPEPLLPLAGGDVNATAFVFGIPRGEVHRFGYDSGACDPSARPASECFLVQGAATEGTLLASIRPVPRNLDVQLASDGAAAHVVIYEGTPVPTTAPLRDMRVFALFGGKPAIRIATGARIG